MWSLLRDSRRSDLCAVEVQVGARGSRTALVLVPGAVDWRAVWVLGGGAGTEKAQLAYLHSRPELNRQCRHVGQLECHVPGETGIDPAGCRMRKQAKPSKAGIVRWDESRPGEEETCRVSDLDAPNRAWLTLAHVDDRTEIMSRSFLEAGGLPFQPKHLEPRRELDLERRCLLDSVKRYPLLPLDGAKTETGRKFDHSVCETLLCVAELTSPVDVYVPIGVHEPLEKCEPLTDGRA